MFIYVILEVELTPTCKNIFPKFGFDWYITNIVFGEVTTEALKGHFASLFILPRRDTILPRRDTILPRQDNYLILPRQVISYLA